MRVFLGEMELRPSEQPESIQRGGGQHLAVHEFPGGNVAVQNFGSKYRQVSWSGWFEGNDAYERMIKIGNMRQKGDPVELRTEKYTQTYVIKEYLPEYRRDTFIPFSITLLPIIETKPQYEEAVDRISRALAEAAKNGDKYFVYNQPPRIGSETPFKLTIYDYDGTETGNFYGFMYAPKGGIPTAYARNGCPLLRWIECEIESYDNKYYRVSRGGKEATVSRLTEGNYTEFDCIRLEDLKDLGIGVDYDRR